MARHIYARAVAAGVGDMEDGGEERTNEKGLCTMGKAVGLFFFFFFFFSFFVFSLSETRDRERERQERVRIQVTNFHLESSLEAMSTCLPTYLPTYLLPFSGMSSRESCYIPLFFF